MGQSSSSQRRNNQLDNSHPSSQASNPRYSLSRSRSSATHVDAEMDRNFDRSSLQRSRSQAWRAVRRHVSDRRASSRRDLLAQDHRDPVPRNDVHYERDDGHYTSMNIRPITMTSANLLRRQSYMSRLGSRLLPDSVARGLVSSGEESPAEGRALRGDNRWSSSPYSRPYPPPAPARPNHYFSYDVMPRSRRSSLLSGHPADMTTVTSVSHRRLRSRSPDRSGSVNERTTTTTTTIIRDRTEPHSSNIQHNRHRGQRSRSRFARVRNSISTIIPGMSAAQGPSVYTSIDTPSARNAAPSASMNYRSANSTPVESESRLGAGPDAGTTTPISASSSAGSTTAHRSSITAHGIRRIPQLFRSRSSHTPRPGEPMTLGGLLAYAAATIAAQLTGHTGSLPELEAVGEDHIDENLQSFLQNLSNVTTRHEEAMQAGSSAHNGQDTAVITDTAPVHIVRAFRYVHPTTMATDADNRSSPAGDSVAESGEGNEDAAEGRTVTLVIVGVRSVPHTTTEDLNDNPSFVLGPPTADHANDAQQHPVLRRTDPRARFHRPQSTYEGRRQPQAQPSSRDPLRTPSDQIIPSSPDDSTNPRLPRSGPSLYHITPLDDIAQRPSSASATSSFAPSTVTLDTSNEIDAERNTTEPIVFQAARQRRRSDSEFARHRDLGSGAARRNGVVAPDDTPSPTTRSWLIYVVGTNLSENHPALATPSLFTDNPTYEDMLLLSSLIGPAKPPVASQSDIDLAGGIFRIIQSEGGLVAVSTTGSDTVTIAADDRCLICLSNYAHAEEVRQLNKCHHVYHRECIDEWLTTGRNSCPLCRGQGVGEASTQNTEE